MAVLQQPLDKACRNVILCAIKVSMEVLSHLQQILQSEFERRKQKNQMYSMRAFSRDLGISSTSLCDAIASKRKLSRENLSKVSQKLCLSPSQMRLLRSEIGQENSDFFNDERLLLEDDTFRLISEWYYIAILNLAKLTDNKADCDWIAERLNISRTNAAAALQRLERLGLLEIKSGKMKRTSRPITTSVDVPSSAIKHYHLDNLELAKKSLENDPVDIRDFSSITMPVDLEKLPQAKKMIMKLKRKISSAISSAKSKEVYTLSVQLFPVSRNNKK